MWEGQTHRWGISRLQSHYKTRKGAVHSHSSQWETDLAEEIPQIRLRTPTPNTSNASLQQSLQLHIDVIDRGEVEIAEMDTSGPTSPELGMDEELPPIAEHAPSRPASLISYSPTPAGSNVYSRRGEWNTADSRSPGGRISPGGRNSKLFGSFRRHHSSNRRASAAAGMLGPTSPLGGRNESPGPLDGPAQDLSSSVNSDNRQVKKRFFDNFRPRSKSDMKDIKKMSSPKNKKHPAASATALSSQLGTGHTHVARKSMGGTMDEELFVDTQLANRSASKTRKSPVAQAVLDFIRVGNQSKKKLSTHSLEPGIIHPHHHHHRTPSEPPTTDMTSSPTPQSPGRRSPTQHRQVLMSQRSLDSSPLEGSPRTSALLLRPDKDGGSKKAQTPSVEQPARSSSVFPATLSASLNIPSRSRSERRSSSSGGEPASRSSRKSQFDSSYPPVFDFEDWAGTQGLSASENEDIVYSQFMKAHKCYDLIPTSTKVVVFDTQLPVRKAFFALVYNGVRAAPLWDSVRREFIGMLTITDFIEILLQYYNTGETGSKELEEHQIATWRNVMKRDDKTKTLISIDPNERLHKGVQILFDKKIHRLPVVDRASGNVLYILTHKRILRFLFLYLQDLPTPQFMHKTPKELNIGTWEKIETVKRETPLIEALSKFISKRVSALPIVDDERRVVDIYAKFDVINLAAEKAYTNLDITVEEALKYRSGWFEGVRTCRVSDSLTKVLDTLVKAEVHRMILTDEERRVVAIVSLSDILAHLILTPHLLSSGKSLEDGETSS